MAAAGLGQEAGLLPAAVPPSPSGATVEAPPPVDDGRAVADVKAEGGEKTLPIADDPQPRAMTVVVAAVLALALPFGAKDGDDGNGEKRAMLSAAPDGERDGLAGGYCCNSNAVAAAAGALAPLPVSAPLPAAKATPPMLVALLALLALLVLGPRLRASCGWLLGPTGSEGEKGSVCGLVPAAPESPCTEGRKA